MTTLLAQIEKEIAKNKKAFRQACKAMDNYREIGFKNLNEKQSDDYSKASSDWQKYETILSSLDIMQAKIKDLINY